MVLQMDYANNGKGALTHFYSKELTAQSELSQNFNVHRERFGV